MNSAPTQPISLRLLNQASLVLFAVVLLVFGMLSPAFLQPTNVLNILLQSSSTGILAVGMTFVLLTAGVDLSVGFALVGLGFLGRSGQEFAFVR